MTVTLGQLITTMTIIIERSIHMTTTFRQIPLYNIIHTSGQLPSMAVILGQSTHNYDNKPSDNFPYENKLGQLRLTTTLGLKTPMIIIVGQLPQTTTPNSED